MGGRFEPSGRLGSGLSALVSVRLKAQADHVLKVAQATAPVDTGRYKNSMKVEKISDTEYQVSANTHYAKYLEFGTRKMRAYRTLGRALDTIRK